MAGDIVITVKILMGWARQGRREGQEQLKIDSQVMWMPAT